MGENDIFSAFAFFSYFFLYCLFIILSLNILLGYKKFHVLLTPEKTESYSFYCQFGQM